MALIDKLEAIADGFRSSRGLTDKLTLDQMAVLAAESGSGGASDDVRYVTFMNGDTVLYVKPVITGDDCVDVLTKGLIETPTKESNVYATYSYSGWSRTAGGSASASALTAVIEDRTVYAAFKATKIFYTINFYDGESLLLSVQAGYGETVEQPAPVKAGYALTGWTPEVTTVTGNADYYAVWEEAIARIADYGWAELSAISQAGNAPDTFMLGDTKTLEIDGVTLTAELVDFNREEPADETKVAGMHFEIQEVYPVDVVFHSGASGTPFNECDIYTKALLSARNAMPVELQNALVTVNKETRYGYDTSVIPLDIYTYHARNVNRYNSDYTGRVAAGHEAVYEKYLSTNAAEKRIKLSAITKEPVEYWLSDITSAIISSYVKIDGSISDIYGLNANKGVVICFCI